MTGLELIIKERQEQIDKHGYTLEEDRFYNKNELLKAALFCIDNNIFEFPFYWNVSTRNKILSKSRIEKLTCAGAFIAAQLDQELLNVGQ